MVIPVGIDIGNDKCVVTVLNEKGVVDVVCIEPSSRETPLLIHFDKRQRLFGSAGVPYSSSNPKASISQLKRLIGRRFDEPSFQNERAFLPYDTSQGPNGEVLVNVAYCGADRTFTAVQLMGMFLSHLKKEAERRLGSEISQCVIGIPSYLTDSQRRDYLLAAEIAGLKPLRLFHDGTATALDYCYFRNLPYAEATHVVFVDIGHSDTQVTVVRFNCETINVLAHYFDRDLGGRDFTDAIFRFFVEQIKGNHNIDVSQDAKQSRRLRRECEKAKKTLSVNSMAPINIDSLTNDIYLEDKIMREEFEERSSDLLDRVLIACDRALDDAHLLKDDIHSVELCGSGSRIPKISQRLKDLFGKSTSRTLNSSECVANGCALQCGMLCPDFYLKRKFGVQDIFPFYVGLSGDEDSYFAPSNIIPKGQFLQRSRAQILHPSKVVTISYAIKKELSPNSWVKVNSYKMDIVPESEKRDQEFRFQFDLHGILSVQSVSGPIKGSKSTRKRVKFSDSFCGAGNEIVLYARCLEEELAGKDSANERAKERRNDVEALLSDIRGKLSSLGGFGTSFKDEISRELDNIAGWLDGPGEDESEMAYSEKFRKLELTREKLLATHEEAKNSYDELLHYVKKVKVELEELLSHDEFKEIREELLHGEGLLDQNLLPKEEYNNTSTKLKSIIQRIEDCRKDLQSPGQKFGRLFSAIRQFIFWITEEFKSSTRLADSAPNKHERQPSGVGGPSQPNYAHVVGIADAIKWCTAYPQWPCPMAAVGTITSIVWIPGLDNRWSPCQMNENIRMMVKAQLTNEEGCLWINIFDDVAERLLGATLLQLLELQKDESTFQREIKRIVESPLQKDITFHLVYYTTGEFVANFIY